MSEIYLGENRVIGTVDLMMLYVTAKKQGLNRNLPDAVAANLDPGGNHVLTTVLLDHRTNPSRNLPRHHRVSVLVKQRDSNRPFCGFLDVVETDWVKLYTREETRSLMVEGQPLELAPRLVDVMEVLAR